MALDLAALAQPSADADQGSDNSALMDALDQMRALCDQIEAEQMKGRSQPKPSEPPVTPSSGEGA